MAELRRQSVSSGTASAGGVIRDLPEAPTTNAALARRAAALRDEVGVLDSDAQSVHQLTQRGDLDDRTALLVRREPQDVLDDLGSTWGLSWASIAKLVSVTSSAVRKWRRGETVSPENRFQLARLYAFLEMLSDYPVGDSASWMEVRISGDATVTPLDLYSTGRTELLFELAGARMTAQQVLDAFDPSWRTRYAVDAVYGVVQGPDGELAIAERQPGARSSAPATPHG